MANSKTVKKDNTDFLMKIVYVVGLAFVIIALLTFLVGKNDQGNSGGYIIFHQGAGYLLLMVVFALIAAGAIIYGLNAYKRTQETKSLLVPFIVAVVFIVIAFGKGCTDKANNGVTGPRGTPTVNR